MVTVKRRFLQQGREHTNMKASCDDQKVGRLQHQSYAAQDYCAHSLHSYRAPSHGTKPVRCASRRCADMRGDIRI